MLKLILGYAIAFLISFLFMIGKVSFNNSTLPFYNQFFHLARVLFSSVFEELVFRKWLLLFLYSLFSPKSERQSIKVIIFVTIFISFLFASAHSGNIEAQEGGAYFIQLFLAGMYFSILYLLTGDIFIPIILHFFNNILATFVLSLYPAFSGYALFNSSIRIGSFFSFLVTIFQFALSLFFIRDKFVLKAIKVKRWR